MTFHSVIDSPLSVSRVIPPTSTIPTTIAATSSSQRASASERERACGWAANRFDTDENVAMAQR